MIFFDTSALAKRYVEEAGSVLVNQIVNRVHDPNSQTDEAEHAPVAVAAITYAEIYALFGRLLRDGKLSLSDYRGLIRQFEQDWRCFIVVEWDRHIRSIVSETIDRHLLRGADLVQFTSLVNLHNKLGVTSFAVSDLMLANAAEKDNIPVTNPAIM